jgi:predicted ABC-type ATPase
MERRYAAFLTNKAVSKLSGNRLSTSVAQVVEAQTASGKPLAIVLAGHNGSGKSTMWYDRLADTLQIPLINADRMMLSILPDKRPLPDWAMLLRDQDTSWMHVAQLGVHAFVAQAMEDHVPFAMETVFSHWREKQDGTFESKIDQIKDMQAAGYFVLLLFVGLTSAQLSVARVATRKAQGGHDVPRGKLKERFPRTQKAISHALAQVDAAILVDNSRSLAKAFSVCRVQIKDEVQYDVRSLARPPAKVISEWLDVVAPNN